MRVQPTLLRLTQRSRNWSRALWMGRHHRKPLSPGSPERMETHRNIERSQFIIRMSVCDFVWFVHDFITCGMSCDIPSFQSFLYWIWIYVFECFCSRRNLKSWFCAFGSLNVCAPCCLCPRIVFRCVLIGWTALYISSQTVEGDDGAVCP